MSLIHMGTSVHCSSGPRRFKFVYNLLIAVRQRSPSCDVIITAVFHTKLYSILHHDVLVVTAASDAQIVRWET